MFAIFTKQHLRCGNTTCCFVVPSEKNNVRREAVMLDLIEPSMPLVGDPAVRVLKSRTPGGTPSRDFPAVLLRNATMIAVNLQHISWTRLLTPAIMRNLLFLLTNKCSYGRRLHSFPPAVLRKPSRVSPVRPSRARWQVCALDAGTLRSFGAHA